MAVITPGAVTSTLTGGIPQVPTTIPMYPAESQLIGAAVKLVNTTRPAAAALTLIGSVPRLSVVTPGHATLTLTGGWPLLKLRQPPLGQSLSLIGHSPKVKIWDRGLRLKGIPPTDAPLSFFGDPNGSNAGGFRRTGKLRIA